MPLGFLQGNLSVQTFLPHTPQYLLELLGSLVPFLGMYSDTVPLLRTLPPSQLCLEFGFHSPAKSCMSYLKPSFSRTLIYDMHSILLKHHKGQE